MDRTAFLRLLSKRLFPHLRDDGFAGSGTTLRRLNGAVLHVFNVQGSANTENFFVNLGATLLPLATGSETQASAIKEYQCIFRERLHPPELPRQNWAYGETEDDAEEVAARLHEAYRSRGRTWFDDHGGAPDSLRRLVDDPTALTLHPAHLLSLARVAEQLGDAERCRTLASEGLKRTPERATGLAADLRQLLDRVGRPVRD